jgi:hypothetical protein
VWCSIICVCFCAEMGMNIIGDLHD